jgi:hypothetical protein
MNNIQREFIIGWKVSTLEPHVASVRYRAFLPILALEQQNVECRVVSDPHCLEMDEIDALVIVKGLNMEDCELAQRAFSKQVPIILDLCDNIFVSDYGQSTIEYRPTPSDAFAIMARYASAVVVSTEPLAELVRLHCGRQHGIFVIPDGVEGPDQTSQIEARRRADRRLQKSRTVRSASRRLLRSLRRLQDFRWMAWDPVIKHYRRVAWKDAVAKAWRALPRPRLHSILSRIGKPPASPGSISPADSPSANAPLKILWFGIHGAEHADFGMLDLLLIQADLEEIAREFDVELVVVSNNREKFERHIQPMKIRTRYLDWSVPVMNRQFQDAALVVVPNSLDSFSLCKSANRTVLALSAGVPVVATLTPALRDLSGCIKTGSFLDSMRWYLSDPQRAAQDVQQGQAVIQKAFGSEKISSLWLEVLRATKHSRSTLAPSGEPAPDAEFVVAIHLVMDIDLALPVIRRAQEMGIAVMVLCNSEIRSAKPDMDAWLRKHCRRYLFVHKAMLDRTFLFPASATALLTFSETNLAPHAFNHQLTKMANSAGLATYTTQHGFENVGLTYDDSAQPIQKIHFAARHIFLWGSLETLHPSVPASTRRKCIPIGCPKPAQAAQAELPDSLLSNRPIVGIFENLHWKRYSDNYRMAFIANVVQLAAQYPDIQFLIKPHNAGLWLTSRFQGSLPSLPNIAIADPKSPQWASSTASGLFWRCTAVITTPSTVALDAARHGLPVAVVAQELPLDNYAPLPLLRDSQGWHRFATDALDAQKRGQLLDHAREFCRRVVLPDDADCRMVEVMLPRHGQITRPQT